MIRFDMINKIKEFNNIFNCIKAKGWIKETAKGYGNAGKTFEKLINNDKNDFEIPDYNGIEIKTKRSDTHLYNTLFNCKPDGPYYMETDRLRTTYGYPDKKYKDQKIFQTDVFYDSFIKVGGKYKLKLEIDEEKQKIYLIICNLKEELIEKSTYWDFDSIKEKLYRKMKILAYIHVTRKYSNGITYFRYKSVDYYKLKSFHDFIDSIKAGKVKVNFKIGIYKSGKYFGKTHDHGTGFSIKEEDFLNIYEKITI